MSSNVEVPKEENVEKKEEKTEEKKQKEPLRKRVLERWQLILKCLELLLCAGCVGVVFEPYSEIGIGKIPLHHVAIVYTAFTGYILINLIMVTSHLMGDKIAYKTNTLFCASAAILFFVAGILAAKDNRERSNSNTLSHPQFYLLQMLAATSVLSFINCAVFIIDAALTIWKKKDF